MAQQYYHIEENGPAPCRAKIGNCPLGGRSGRQDHWNSIEDATDVFVSKMAPKYGKSAISVAERLKKAPKYRFYNTLDNSPGLMRTFKVLKSSAKVTTFVVGTTIAATMAIARFASSLITKRRLGGRRKLNAKKLLLTKYWMPDIHSKKWRYFSKSFDIIVLPPAYANGAK